MSDPAWNTPTHPGQVVVITGAAPSDAALADTGDGPIAIPEPPERPDPKAQWDEVHGCWIRWDEASGRWVPESQALVIDLRDDPTAAISDVLAARPGARN